MVAAGALALRKRSAQRFGLALFDVDDEEMVSTDGFNVSIEAPLATDVE